MATLADVAVKVGMMVTVVRVVIWVVIGVEAVVMGLRVEALAGWGEPVAAVKEARGEFGLVALVHQVVSVAVKGPEGKAAQEAVLAVEAVD